MLDSRINVNATCGIWLVLSAVPAIALIVSRGNAISEFGVWDYDVTVQAILYPIMLLYLVSAGVK